MSDLGVPTTERRFPTGDLLRVDRLLLREHGPKAGRGRWLETTRTSCRSADAAPARSSTVTSSGRCSRTGWTTTTSSSTGSGSSLEQPEVRRALAHRFRHVLVDEYQDVNRLQADIVDLAGRRSASRNVMVVGDDAQSIYSFRGADFEALLGVPRPLSRARRVYKLETNYRSTPEILRARGRLHRAATRGASRRTLVATRGAAACRWPSSAPRTRPSRPSSWRSGSWSCATRGRRSPRSRSSTAPTTRRWSCRSS